MENPRAHEPRLIPSNIVSAFDSQTIGTKVTPFHVAAFMQMAKDAIAKYDFAAQRVPGQGFIVLPEEATQVVGAGVGKRTSNEYNYVCREHRGIVSAYLKRKYAAECTGVAIVVYTKEAYLADPDTVGTDEYARVEAIGCTHVLVAILAFAGPNPPALPAYRLVWNLAGGNKEALVWTADEIRAKAKAAIDYDNEWVTVAD